MLQLVTRYQFLIEDFKNLIEIKNVPTLFEYWCFFIVKDILDKKFKPLTYSVIVSYTETEQKVQEGIAIEYEDGISLIYNSDYVGSSGVDVRSSGLQDYHTGESCSHQLRPDIVVVKDGKEKLILDAKYKGKNGGGGFYGEETAKGTIMTYKVEDLDKMHTYHDAIKDVFGAFALYPGKESVIYPSHQAKRTFQGVGALPLRPVSGGNPDAEHIANLERAIDDFIEA